MKERILRWNPAWLVLALWIVVCAILYLVGGPTSKLLRVGGLVALPVIIGLVWSVRRDLRRQMLALALTVVASLSLSLLPTPHANAYVYPNGCKYVYHPIGVQEQGITVAWVYTTVDVCQGPGGNATPSSFMTAEIVSTSWGNILGYSFGTSGGVKIGANTPSLQTRSIDLWARVCLAKVTPICMPTADFRVSARITAGNITGSPYTPILQESGYCMNSWCASTAWYQVAWWHALSFTGAMTIRVAV